MPLNNGEIFAGFREEASSTTTPGAHMTRRTRSRAARPHGTPSTPVGKPRGALHTAVETC